ncbi:MAG: hypothetical protein Q7S87_08875 [Agitococcus sp.]|nr:hypothetical protein [Agitococcus sp.]MDO9177013.1 hypothetical protein [Agitococcus sp.]
MFSLIVSIISIALAIALSAAAMFYGGNSFGALSQKAHAAQLIDETQQIQAAILLFKEDNARLPISSAELTISGKYLKSMPTGWEDASTVFKTNAGRGIGESTCLDFNKQKNIPFVPKCSDEAYRQIVVCCIDTPLY